MNAVIEETQGSETEPGTTSALAICCLIMLTVLAGIVLSCMLLDRLGFAKAGFGLLMVTSLPLMLFAGRSHSTVTDKPWRNRWGAWFVLGIWSIHSFLLLLAAQRFFG